MKIILSVLLIGTGVFGIFWYVWFGGREQSFVLSPVGHERERPLDKYTIDALSIRQGKQSQIVLGEPISTSSAYRVHNFSFVSDEKKITGLAHVPDSDGPFPVIVQFRGYVDPTIYVSGIGTKRSAEVFASNGYISLAPDFLGYGGSDYPSTDVFEERFQTYTAALDLFSSISTLPQADKNRIGIWAHSNGGHIALTLLAITGQSYPTSLWAPVTKPFPYSILYYTDEAPDYGKALRAKLAEFEKKYNTDLFTVANYQDRIIAPIQVHQGTGDRAVPFIWSDQFVERMRELKKDIQYYAYSGADHNLTPAWNTVISRDLEFFSKHLQP